MLVMIIKLYLSILLYNCETWTLLADSEKKDPGFQNHVQEETSPYLLLGAQDSVTGCSARSTSLWVHRHLFWQLSRDGNLHGSGMSHATTASPKPPYLLLGAQDQ